MNSMFFSSNGNSNCYFFYSIDGLSVAESMYSSKLTVSTQTYSRECSNSKYYYETIQVHVEETGNYSFTSISSIKTYGYIYNNSFNPFNPNENLLSDNDVKCDKYQFQLKVYLQINVTYILVVTTFSPKEIGNFSVHATGPGNISLNQISEYL